MDPILTTLVAAALAYLVGRRQEAAKRDDRRPVVATALLTELHSLEIGLRRLAVHETPGSSTLAPDTSTYESLRGEVVLFKPVLAQELIIFQGLVSEIKRTRDRVVQRQLNADAGLHGWVRFKATAAANIIPKLRRLLEDAGGKVLPDDRQAWFENLSDLKLVVPPAFHTTDEIPGHGSGA